MVYFSRKSATNNCRKAFEIAVFNFAEIARQVDNNVESFSFLDSTLTYFKLETVRKDESEGSFEQASNAYAVETRHDCKPVD